MNEDDQTGSPFDKRCEILADFWMYNRDEPKLKDFTGYNDVGLPAAWLVDEGLATPQPPLILLISETFDVLLGALQVEKDPGFDSIDDLLELLPE